MTAATTALVSASGEARLRASASFIEAFPAATEVLVIGPTRGAVDDLVRRVALGAPGDATLGAHRATFGLHRKTLAGLMVELAAPRLADRQRGLAPRLALEAVVASVVEHAVDGGMLDYFGTGRGKRPVAMAPSFPRALLMTLLDLRRACVDPAHLRERSPAESDLAVLLELYESELSARGLADTRDVAEEALIAVEDAPVARFPVVFADVPLACVADAEFVRALTQRAPSYLFTVPRGDEATVSALRSIGIQPTRSERSEASSLERAQERLFSDDPGEPATPDDSVTLMSAPSEAHEMIEIARKVVEIARTGVPFDAIAIALPSRSTYALHLETALGRAGIPAYFAFGTRRPHASGRALCALLACKIERFSARRFAEYLSLGQVPDERRADELPARSFLTPLDETLGRFGAQEVPPADEDAEGQESPGDDAPKRYGRIRAPRRWERLLGEAATLEVGSTETGRAYYQRRIGALVSAFRRAREALVRDDPSSPRIHALDRDIADSAELLSFAGPVLDACDRLPVRAPWKDWLTAIEGLARTALRKPEAVLAVLAELTSLSGSPPVAIDQVRDILEPRLSDLDRPRPASRFGRIFVAVPRDLRGRSFRVVFVPGLTERVFPARVREDPLLVDDARRALARGLTTNDQRSQDERLALLCAVGAATERAVLSYPRVEAELGRPRVPSFYALDVARATSARLPDVEEMQRDAARVADARLDWPAPREPARAIDELEHDLSVLRGLLDAKAEAKPEGRGRYLLEENPHLARALRARFSRFDRTQITSNDGLVRLSPQNLLALGAHSLRARAFSVSALQLYASCPYRFYLSAILGLAPRDTPLRAESLDPRTRGDLFHRVAAELTRSLADEGLLPVAPDGLAHAQSRLRTLFERAKAELDDALQPVVPRVFEADCAEVLADLEVLIETDLVVESEFTPLFVDLGFGVPKHEHLDPGGTTAPLLLRGGFLLRGAIDAVERNRSTGKLRVTDYKTGAPRGVGALSIGGGEVLQPVLYSLAVEALRGVTFAMDAEVTEARLSYATKRGGYTDRVVRIDADAIRRASNALEAIDDALRDGFLMARPKKDACALCSFKAICGLHEEARTHRKIAGSPSEKRHLEALSDTRRQR